MSRATGLRSPDHVRRRAPVPIGSLEPYLWVSPAVALFVMFIAYPVFFAFRLAFHDWSGLTPIAQMAWVGLANYRELVQDPIMQLAIRNSFVYAIATTVAFSVLAFLLAFALWYEPPPGAGFLRSLIFYPSVLSGVILALAWFRMYAFDGLINDVLVGVLGQPTRILWLSNVNLALWAVMGVDVWRSTGWTMVLYLAGLSGISRELLDSARLEGAGSFQLVRHIAEPLVRPVTGLAVLLNVIGGLQVFGPVWVLTQGGPLHRTEVLSSYSWWLAFAPNGVSRLGYAAAVTSVGGTLLFALSILSLRVRRFT
jgi:ABC-type sugar transport system permease subunit